jgi:hypothetical protein
VDGVPGRVVPSGNRLNVAEAVIAKHEEVVALLAQARELPPRPAKAVPVTDPVPVSASPSTSKEGPVPAVQSRTPATVAQKVVAQPPPAARARAKPKRVKPEVSPEERQRIDLESARKQAAHLAMVKRKGERKKALAAITDPDVQDHLSQFGDDELAHAAWMGLVGTATAMLGANVSSDLVLRALAHDVKHHRKLASLRSGEVAGYLTLLDARKISDARDEALATALVTGEPIEGASSAGDIYTTRHALDLMTALRPRNDIAIADVQWLVTLKNGEEFGNLCRVFMDATKNLAAVRRIVIGQPRYTRKDRVRLCADFNVVTLATVLTWPHLDTDLIYDHVKLIMENRDEWGMANQIIALRAVAHVKKPPNPATFDLVFNKYGRFKGDEADRANKTLVAKTGFFTLTFGAEKYPLHSHWYEIGTGQIFSMHVAHTTPRIKLVDKVFTDLVTKAVLLHNNSPIQKPRSGGDEFEFVNWLLT